MIIFGHSIEPVFFNSRRLFAPCYVGHLAGIGRLLLGGLVTIAISGVLFAAIRSVTDQGRHRNKAIVPAASADWPA